MIRRRMKDKQVHGGAPLSENSLQLFSLFSELHFEGKRNKMCV